MLIAYCLENNYPKNNYTQSYKNTIYFRKKEKENNYVTKYEKLDVYTHNLQNNLENGNTGLIPYQYRNNVCDLA